MYMYKYTHMDYPRLTVVEFMMFLFYNGMKAIDIQ